MKKFLTWIAVLGLLPMNFAFASESESETESEVTEVTEIESNDEEETTENEADSSEEEAGDIESYFGLYEREQNYKSLKLDLDSKLTELSDEEFYDLALQIAYNVATGDTLEATIFEGFTESPEEDPAPSSSTFAFTLALAENDEVTFTDINKDAANGVTAISLDEYPSDEVEEVYNMAYAVNVDNGRKLVYFTDDQAIVVNTLGTSPSIFVSQYIRTEEDAEKLDEKVQEILDYNESLN